MISVVESIIGKLVGFIKIFYYEQNKEECLNKLLKLIENLTNQNDTFISLIIKSNYFNITLNLFECLFDVSNSNAINLTDSLINKLITTYLNCFTLSNEAIKPYLNEDSFCLVIEKLIGIYSEISTNECENSSVKVKIQGHLINLLGNIAYNNNHSLNHTHRRLLTSSDIINTILETYSKNNLEDIIDFLENIIEKQDQNVVELYYIKSSFYINVGNALLSQNFLMVVKAINLLYNLIVRTDNERRYIIYGKISELNIGSLFNNIVNNHNFISLINNSELRNLNGGDVGKCVQTIKDFLMINK